MIDTSGTIQPQPLYTACEMEPPGFAGSSFPDRYAFSQRENDPESALMHYRARSYDPDPIACQTDTQTRTRE